MGRDLLLEGEEVIFGARLERFEFGGDAVLDVELEGLGARGVGLGEGCVSLGFRGEGLWLVLGLRIWV